MRSRSPSYGRGSPVRSRRCLLLAADCRTSLLSPLHSWHEASPRFQRGLACGVAASPRSSCSSWFHIWCAGAVTAGHQPRITAGPPSRSTAAPCRATAPCRDERDAPQGSRAACLRCSCLCITSAATAICGADRACCNVAWKLAMHPRLASITSSTGNVSGSPEL